MKKAVFFDVGHTLVYPPLQFYRDVSRALGGATEDTALLQAEREARQAYEEAVLDQGAAHLWDVYFDRFFEKLGIPASRWEDGLKIVRYAHRQFIGLFHVVFPEVPETLRILYQKGIPLGVISNADRRLPDQLSILGLRPWFRWILSSEDLGVSKPDPQIFNIALDRCGLPPERVIYVGDYPRVDIEPARRLGIRAFLLDPYAMYPDYPYRIRSLPEILPHIGE